MIKLFISQPVRGKSDEEIIAERNRIVHQVEDDFDEPVELVDSFFREPEEPLKMLGRSIQLMADADMVFCAKGWEEARGCRIEHDCAIDYGKDTIVELTAKPSWKTRRLVRKAAKRIRKLRKQNG